jgi:hypothetical protein
MGDMKQKHHINFITLLRSPIIKTMGHHHNLSRHTSHVMDHTACARHPQYAPRTAGCRSIPATPRSMRAYCQSRPPPCYTSHVTRHTSHITNRTSHVTRHMSPEVHNKLPALPVHQLASDTPAPFARDVAQLQTLPSIPEVYAMCLQHNYNRRRKHSLYSQQARTGVSCRASCQTASRSALRASHAPAFALHARHTSRVTHHTSRVTHHTSRVTHHTSHVTPHTSRITRHTSHVTRRTCKRELRLLDDKRHQAAKLLHHTLQRRRGGCMVQRQMFTVLKKRFRMGPGWCTSARVNMADGPSLASPLASMVLQRIRILRFCFEHGS